MLCSTARDPSFCQLSLLRTSGATAEAGCADQGRHSVDHRCKAHYLTTRTLLSTPSTTMCSSHTLLLRTCMSHAHMRHQESPMIEQQIQTIRHQPDAPHKQVPRTVIYCPKPQQSTTTTLQSGTLPPLWHMGLCPLITAVMATTLPHLAKCCTVCRA